MTGRIQIDPPTATVAVDGKPVALREGSLELSGAPGTSFTVVVSDGARTRECRVVLGIGGPSQDRIELPAPSADAKASPVASVDVKPTPADKSPVKGSDKTPDKAAVAGRAPAAARAAHTSPVASPPAPTSRATAAPAAPTSSKGQSKSNIAVDTRFE